jgi:hypothetical protein
MKAAIFVSKPIVTDDLDKPAKKKQYDPKHEAKKLFAQVSARLMSESVRPVKLCPDCVCAKSRDNDDN